MLDLQTGSVPKSKRIQLSSCTVLRNLYPALRGRLNGERAGRRAEGHTSWLQVAPPANLRALVLMGTLAESGCFGKPETTTATKGLLVGCTLLLCIHRPLKLRSQRPPARGMEEWQETATET